MDRHASTDLSGRLTFILVLALGGQALAFPDGAEPGHSGLGDEHDCGSCHYLGPAPDKRSGLTFDSLPERVAAGDVVEFRLRLSDPEGRIGGFQLTADAAGESAGWFDAGSDQQLAELDGREYLGHSNPRASTETECGESRVIEWTVRWRAPTDANSVTLAAAAVAANEDASALGDNAYRHEQTIEVVDPGN